MLLHERQCHGLQLLKQHTIILELNITVQNTASSPKHASSRINMANMCCSTATVHFLPGPSLCSHTLTHVRLRCRWPWPARPYGRLPLGCIWLHATWEALPMPRALTWALGASIRRCTFKVRAASVVGCVDVSMLMDVTASMLSMHCMLAVHSAMC